MACGNCGTIKVDANKVARVLDSLIDFGENADDGLSDFASDFLWEISEPINDKMSLEKLIEWEYENEHRVYDFIENCEYAMSGKYDEIILSPDTECNCYNKDKITDITIVSI